MKNYIANMQGDWATSAAYVKYSFERCIHHGRLYANGHGIFKGNDEDLAEALRCLGQGLHCLEDFGAHTNYVELALRELGLHNVFPHTGTATAINLRGKHTFPLVTGTFGMVDFFHSVLGEATDHFTQTEISEMDNALCSAQSSSQSSNPLNSLTSLLSKIPGTKDLCTEAERLHASSQAQARASGPSSSTRGVGDFNQQPGWHEANAVYQQGYNQQAHWNQQPSQPQWGQQQQQQQQPGAWDQPPPRQHQWEQQHQQAQWGQQQPQRHPEQHSQPPFTNQQAPPHAAPPQQRAPGPGLPGIPNFDPSKTVQQIYPILVFRDKVVRSISAIISKIPGLETLVDKITETLTVFILSLLAPFIRPIINGLTTQLQAGSSAVVDSSGKHQYEPWTDPHCTDPTHSMLSKDHFSNILNEPAGQVASEILKFVAPRVMYAWDHPNVPVQQVLDDCMKVFHHPAARDHHCEVHRNMFDAVQKWASRRPGGGRDLDDILSSESVRAGRNHKDDGQTGGAGGHSHAAPGATPAQHSIGGMSAGFPGQQQQQHHHHSQSGGGWGGSSPQPQHSHHQSAGSGGGGGFNPLAQLSHVPGMSGVSSTLNKVSSFVPGGLGGFGGSSHGGGGGGRRGLDDDDNDDPSSTGPAYQDQGQGQGQAGLLQPEMPHGTAMGIGAGESISRAHSPLPPPGYEGYHGAAGQGEYRPEGGYQGGYGTGQQQQQQHAQGQGQGQGQGHEAYGQPPPGGAGGVYDDHARYQGGQSAQYYDDAGRGQEQGPGLGNMGRDDEYYR